MILKLKSIFVHLVNWISNLYIKCVLFFKVKFLPIGIIVEGGLGGQLLSIAIYNRLKNQGFSVFYDLRYFDRDASFFKDGLSQWKWQLDSFNIDLQKLPVRKISVLDRLCLIRDGVFKFELGLKSISDAINTDLVVPTDELEEEFQNLKLGKYVSVHLRQGDYLSVASFVPEYEDFYRYIRLFIDGVDQLVIFSDGPIPENIIKKVECLEKRVILFPNSTSSPQLTHLVIQRSDVSIVSNSQFSLTAGFYSKACLIPTKWNENNKYNSILSAHISMGLLD